MWRCWALPAWGGTAWTGRRCGPGPLRIVRGRRDARIGMAPSGRRRACADRRPGGGVARGCPRPDPRGDPAARRRAAWRPTAHGAWRRPAWRPVGARRLCALDAVERVDRAAMLALWALAQPLAQVVEARVAPRVGGEVVWAEAVLRVARDNGRAVIVGAASVGWAITDDRIAAWLGAPLEELPELLLVAVDPPGTAAPRLWCCHARGFPSRATRSRRRWSSCSPT